MIYLDASILLAFLTDVWVFEGPTPNPPPRQYNI